MEPLGPDTRSTVPELYWVLETLYQNSAVAGTPWAGAPGAVMSAVELESVTPASDSLSSAPAAEDTPEEYVPFVGAAVEQFPEESKATRPVGSAARSSSRR